MIVPAPVDVAAAVLIRADGQTLLAQRPRDKVYAGYWEFPGGKVESGEPVADALRREIREELGVEPLLERLDARLHTGLKLIQVRERGLRRDALGNLAERVIALARPCGAKVLVNADIALAHMIGADGVHLTSEQLHAAADR